MLDAGLFVWYFIPHLLLFFSIEDVLKILAMTKSRFAIFHTFTNFRSEYIMKQGNSAVLHAIDSFCLFLHFALTARSCIFWIRNKKQNKIKKLFYLKVVFCIFKVRTFYRCLLLIFIPPQAKTGSWLADIFNCTILGSSE